MSAALDEMDGEPIGRCYTKARRTPLVVGAVPGGNGRSLRLPLGPYTITQLAVIVATVVLLIVTRPVWGGHGLGDVLVLVGAPFGAAFLLRHLHIDGRNPAAAAASVAVMLAGPRYGRLHGRPYRPARARHHDTVATVESSGPPHHDTPPPAPAFEAADAPRTIRAAPPARTGTPAAQAPCPGPVAPGPAAHGGVPVASGVQTLLARRAAARTALED